MSIKHTVISSYLIINYKLDSYVQDSNVYMHMVDLNVSKLVMLTILLGREFHSLIVYGKKEC